MANILIAGPAGANKSEVARDLLRESNEPAVLADFTSLAVALLGLERGRGGKYPVRPDWVLPVVEFTRQSVITGANSRGLRIIATTSDGSPERRKALLSRLGAGGAGATEVLVDPGIEVVSARLSDPVTGELSGECSRAIQRWYSRK